MDDVAMSVVYRGSIPWHEARTRLWDLVLPPTSSFQASPERLDKPVPFVGVWRNVLMKRGLRIL